MVNHIAHYCVVGESMLRSFFQIVINGGHVSYDALPGVPTVRGLELDSSDVLDVGRLDDPDRRVLSNNALHSVGLSLNAKLMSLITLLSNTARGGAP